jgi:hypothetical protein
MGVVSKLENLEEVALKLRSLVRIECKAWALVAALAVVLTSINGCGLFPKNTESIPANLSIEVTDPVFRRITTATENFKLVASGEFNKGVIWAHGIPISVQDGTKFNLEMAMPVKDPTHLYTSQATGFFRSSKPISVSGVSMPLEIRLADGKASGEVDLAETLGTFLFNLLQTQFIDFSGGGDLKKLLKTARIDEAELKLRAGSSFDLGRLHICAAPNSVVNFTALTFDRALDYSGKCQLSVNFAPGSGYMGEKVDVLFNGGSSLIKLNAERHDRVLTLNKQDVKQVPVVLRDCTYRFGKDKKSLAHAQEVVLDFSKFIWQKEQGMEHAASHTVAAMILRQTRVELRNPRALLTATFSKDVPAVLQIDREEKAHQTLFATNGLVPADTLNINFRRTETSTDIALTRCLVGPIEINKSGDLNFSLAQGTAVLNSIEWTSGKRQFRLKPSGNSTISITKGMSMDLTRSSSGLSYSLPLSISLAQADLIGGDLDLKLVGLKGNLDIDVDKEVRLDGDLDFGLSQLDLLGQHQVNVRVRGIEISSVKGSANLHLRQCSVVLPSKALNDGINDQLPKEKSYKIDKVVLKGQKWRYRDAVVTALVLKKATVSKLFTATGNIEHFTADGYLIADGTVE